MRIEWTNSQDALIDSNILLYAYDENEPVKQGIAVDLIEGLALNHALGLSVQTLNEFYNAARHPRRGFNLSHDQIVSILTRTTKNAMVFNLTPTVALRAYEAIGRHGFSLWDSLIWAVAKENGIGIIYTEDAQSAEVIEGVRYINPFTAKEEQNP